MGVLESSGWITGCASHLRRSTTLLSPACNDYDLGAVLVRNRTVLVGRLSHSQGGQTVFVGIKVRRGELGFDEFRCVTQFRDGFQLVPILQMVTKACEDFKLETNVAAVPVEQSPWLTSL